MKKLVVLVVALVMVLGVSTVYAKQENTGCGLGTIAFPNANSLFMELVVTCTNGLFGNQTFGISSGTLNCEKPGNVASSQRLNDFVASNLDSLAQDIAAGEGESLDTLAELMEVPAAERTEFASALQSNFSNIFTSSDVSSANVIDNIARVTTGS